MTPNKQLDQWENKFDDTWKSLYVFVPGLGQGDPRNQIKAFIRKVTEDARKDERERIGRWLKNNDVQFAPLKKHSVNEEDAFCCPECGSDDLTMIGDREYNDEWECDKCHATFPSPAFTKPSKSENKHE